MTQTAFVPREFDTLDTAAKAIGQRSCVDYMACIKNDFDKHQRFAFSVENFVSDLERRGFKDGRDSVKVWLPE